MVVTRAGELAGHGGRLPTAGTTLEADLENQADRLDVRNRRNQKKKSMVLQDFYLSGG